MQNSIKTSRRDQLTATQSVLEKPCLRWLHLDCQSWIVAPVRSKSYHCRMYHLRDIHWLIEHPGWSSSGRSLLSCLWDRQSQAHLNYLVYETDGQPGTSLLSCLWGRWTARHISAVLFMRQTDSQEHLCYIIYETDISTTYLYCLCNMWHLVRAYCCRDLAPPV